MESRDDIDLLRARVYRALLHGGILFLLLVAVFFSRSRAGALLGVLSVVLSVLLFARQTGKAFSMKSTTLVSLLAVLVAASIAILPVLNRFMTLNPMEDDRWIIFRSTLSGIASFFPVGTGPGTFPEIYRAFQPVEKLFFVNHVHNDYLEILFEMGFFGAIIIAGFLLLYVQGWRRLRRQHWDELHYFQVASGIGIFILLLHSLVDFNLHTPANAIVFAFLCGVFFRKQHHLHRHRKSRSRSTRSMD
jgi:O-antigen ligase